VEKFVDYFPERTEESSFLCVVNMNLILISSVNLYLSIDKQNGNQPLFQSAPQILMRHQNPAFHNPS
jgi:hypothetical protein